MAPYALCSSRCAITLYPGNRNFVEKYLHILVAMQQFDQARNLVKENEFNILSGYPPSRKGKFLLEASRIFIGYGAYKEGAKFAGAVLKHYPIGKKLQKTWKDVFHHAIRNDERIPYDTRPILHEFVKRHIPEVKE